MAEFSNEQWAVIKSGLSPMSVIACAGSGKTHTAVRRLAEMRRLLGQNRGRVALLSFSNIAVDTFRKKYRSMALEMSFDYGYNRVEIDTLDSFITRHVLHTHAHRTMQSTRAAFLASGTESFLAGFTFSPNGYPVPITSLQIGWRDSGVYFYYSNNDHTLELDHSYASSIVHRLGKVGAYTHNLGRYWCYRTLQEQPCILRALAHRYPHILIDEAQDIGSLHQAILEQLIGAGVQVSLIGDPNQGIFEFAGANGKFLSQYGSRKGVTEFKLTKNYRSVPTILGLANRLSARTDSPHRLAHGATTGAFFIPYKTAERDKLIQAFQARVIASGLMLERSAVLCRGRELANKLAGADRLIGQGSVKGFAQAAIARDKNHDYNSAYKGVAICIAGLLVDLPEGWLAMIINSARNSQAHPLRRLIWRFTRNVGTGLPAATLQADGEWHALLVSRVKALLSTLENDHGLKAVGNIGMRLANKKLPKAPLLEPLDLAVSYSARIRVDTVHQAKGESLDAVLYMANKEHVTAMLNGVASEIGRIGYVAVTRARDLLWVAIPANSLVELRPKLVTHGLQEIAITDFMTAQE